MSESDRRASTSIRGNSLMTMEVVAALFVAVFAVAAAIYPIAAKVEVHASEIRSNTEGIQANARDNKAILKLMIKATNSLSRLEGKVDVIISQGP